MDDNEPTLPATTPTGYSGKPSDPALCPGTPKSKSQPLDVSSDEEEIGMIPHPSASSTQRFAHFVLHNFFIATPLIFLIIFVPFFAVAWFTVLQDAQSMSVQTPSNPTGASILGRVCQVDLDRGVLSISWEAVNCSANAVSEDPFRGIRSPAECKPFEKPINVYLNDLSKPKFSSIPHTELISKQVGIWDPPRFTMEHRFDKCGKQNPVTVEMHK